MSSSRDSFNLFTRSTQKQRDEHQYRLQRGIALAALEAKSTGKVAMDCRNQPMHYANGAARFGFKELEQRIKGRSVKSFSILEREDSSAVSALPDDYENGTGRKRWVLDAGRLVRVE